MKNRITPGYEDDITELRTFFLPCEFKPNTPFFSILDPFAYNIQPAFIHGSLGIISYNPETYSIIDIDDVGSPLLGYIMTITEPDTIMLLDKIKGYFGPNAFNTHNKKVVKAFTDIEMSQDAWIYQLSETVLEKYQQIEQVELGIWDESDENQVDFLEKIGEGL